MSEVREGYKMTELGEMPIEWEVTKIEELINSKFITHHIDGNHGSLYPRSDEFIDAGVPYISANSIKNGRIDFNMAKYLSAARAAKFKKGVAEDNDVLFAHNATVGPVALLKTKEDFVILSTSLTLFRCEADKLSSNYLMYYLMSPTFKHQYEKIMGQTTRNQVPITIQKQLLCILPDVREQQKIASILSTVDKQIDETEQLIVKTKELKKGLMQQLLTKGIGHTEFKQTELGEIPVEWEIFLLEEIVSVLDGMRKPIKKNDRLSGPIPYYGATGIIDWVNDFIFDEPLILVGEDGENLRSRVLPMAFKIQGKAWVNNHAHVVKPNPNVNIDYLTYYLESINYEDYITGSAQPKLNQAQLKRVKTLLPKLNEQQKIASILATVDEQIGVCEQEKAKYEELKKGLMQQLLTGQIRVKI